MMHWIPNPRIRFEKINLILVFIKIYYHVIRGTKRKKNNNTNKLTSEKEYGRVRKNFVVFVFFKIRQFVLSEIFSETRDK